MSLRSLERGLNLIQTQYIHSEILLSWFRKYLKASIFSVKHANERKFSGLNCMVDNKYSTCILDYCDKQSLQYTRIHVEYFCILFLVSSTSGIFSNT